MMALVPTYLAHFGLVTRVLLGWGKRQDLIVRCVMLREGVVLVSTGCPSLDAGSGMRIATGRVAVASSRSPRDWHDVVFKLRL